TVGLFTLMMQAGLHVPADEGTELSIFNNVYADIGDEQSIEQSLSTFSSHMKNIVEILKNVTEKDLVLFDELGAGTDPTEGAALAQSILSKLLEKNIRSLATTHYSELKSYALSTPGIENASVEFNVETLSPTFRLSIGIPGKSNAFEISKKLGLSEDIIEAAKDLLSSETVKFEDVIANAEYHRQIAEKERAIAEEVRKETIQLRDEAEKLRKKTEENRANTTRKAKEEAKRIMLDAKHKADEILRDLKKLKNQANLPHHEILKLQKSLNDNLDSLSADLVLKNDDAFMPPKDLNIGDRVLVVNLNTEADVLAPPDAKGEVQLQAGIMKLKAHISQLKQLKNIETTKPQTSFNIKRDSLNKQSLPLEVDVRGMALDEATVEVDNYLYQALMVGYKEVYIIHGKGTGVLKTGISKHLKNKKHVKSFRLGRYGEGEDGVTVVSLK
ncbi:MAG: endonuclease MutS2, partial [Christensenellaceae bacterium]|nr:endonuclease MutS2 [Christensenellaceae bacterium]